MTLTNSTPPVTGAPRRPQYNGEQVETPSLPFRVGSSVVMGVTGFISRVFLFGASKVTVRGLEEFSALLESRSNVQSRTRGLLTVSNHLSVYDDPLMWGVLPFKWHWSPNDLRWSLASHDIAFKQKSVSTFFTLGQTLPTHRLAHSQYGGLFQNTMTQTIRLLSSFPYAASSSSSSDSFSSSSAPSTKGLEAPEPHDPFTAGDLTYTTNGIDRFSAPSAFASRRHAWVHIFPEGRIHQHPDHTMRYFKWGVSRLILETEPCPDFVPIWIEGFDQVMHEAREWPRPIPRPGKNIVVTFGEKVDVDAVFGDLRRRWKALVDKEKDRLTYARTRRKNSAGWLDRLLVDNTSATEDDENASISESTKGEELQEMGILTDRLKYGSEAVELREECTMRVREEVLRLRHSIGLPAEDPKARLVDTWRQEGQPSKREGRMLDGSWVKDT